jgi:hypothetical protein
MPNYSYDLIQGWLKSIIGYHPDEEVKDEAVHLLKMFQGESYKRHRAYMIQFIDDNKLETVKNKPVQIN